MMTLKKTWTPTHRTCYVDGHYTVYRSGSYWAIIEDDPGARDSRGVHLTTVGTLRDAQAWITGRGE